MMAKRTKKSKTIEVFAKSGRWWIRRNRRVRTTSYSTRMNARRAARREHPDLQIVSV
jgi:hypothetical protein